MATPKPFEPLKYDYMLNLSLNRPEGLPITIREGIAKEMIDHFKLKLTCRIGDMTGEASALFKWEDVTLRIKKHWTGQYRLFKGDWKRDPRWTGD